MANGTLGRQPGDGLMEDGLATVQEASAFLSVSRAKLYAMMDARDLAYVKLGRSRRIPWRAIKQLAASCLVGA
jgi:excisionase family DNA binding protein